MLLEKSLLPSLFFHQIILQRNIWQQLTNGLLPPVVVAVPLPPAAGAAGKCHLPPRCPPGDTGAAGTGTHQHRVPCSKRGAGERRNICHVPAWTPFHPELCLLWCGGNADADGDLGSHPSSEPGSSCSQGRIPAWAQRFGSVWGVIVHRTPPPSRG